MHGGPSSARLRWARRRVNAAIRDAELAAHSRILTTEHLFAILIEHMFATLDIRRLLSLLAASAVALALVMSYAAPPAAAHPIRITTACARGRRCGRSRSMPTRAPIPRDAVYRIEQANDIHDAVISVGQVLVLP